VSKYLVVISMKACGSEWGRSGDTLGGELMVIRVEKTWDGGRLMV
jgi:hypothetical protein